MFALAAAVLQQGAQTRAAGDPGLLPDRVIAVLAAEISGETAKRNLEFVARQHRMRGSRGFLAAAEHIAAELRRYGLAEVAIDEFPADGRTFYGSQKARPAWDAEFAELWELVERDGEWQPAVRIASWDAMPVTLAQDSDSADVVAELVDVGAGTSERDYAGTDVRDRIVLASSQPGPVAALAVARYGAAGIVSYAQNQQTAWWREDENLVRWGHLDSFAPTRTFAFMVSLKQARAFQERLARGERIRLHAQVHAERRAGAYHVLTAAIPGADAALRNEEIVFSCHLDHQRPGANDNASGCVTILEVARTLSKLIRERKLSPPARTIRFIWPPEIEGTMALFHARPEMRRRFRAAVHMDMVGGGPETKAIFHVTRGPLSLPSFVYDVGQAFGSFVNVQSQAFASARGDARYPLYSREGGKEALLAELAEFSMGSDHEVYTEGSFRIPAIYLNDWPDRYIHTNFDLPANIDATKLTRAAFIGAASGWFLANLVTDDVPAVWDAVRPLALRRAALVVERRRGLAADEAANLTRVRLHYEREAFAAIASFASIPEAVRRDAEIFFADLQRLLGPTPAPRTPTGEAALVFSRNPGVTGPTSVFGYDYFSDHYRGPPIRLPSWQGERGSGGEYTYEVLSLVDGRRTAQAIRDIVSAEFGPVPLDVVVEYLRALESIGVVNRKG